MSFWQSDAKIEGSTGICVFPGKDCVREGRRRKRDTIFPGRLSGTASRWDAKVEQICETYLDDAIKSLAGQGRPRVLAIANAKSACLQDIGLTGDEKVKADWGGGHIHEI